MHDATHALLETEQDSSPLYLTGQYVAITPSTEEPFWLGELLEDVFFYSEDVKIRWIEPNKQRRRKSISNVEYFHFANVDSIPSDSIICQTQLDHLSTRSSKSSTTTLILSKREKLAILSAPQDTGKMTIEWISSHLHPDRVIWSSDPTVVPVDLSNNSTLIQTSTPHSENWTFEINQAINLLNKATAVLVIAGAGMSVDSGLPDYRGVNGFWRAYPPLEKLGLKFDDCHQPDWFCKDPKQAWGFYGHRIHLYNQAQPHNGFHLLLNFLKTKKYFIFTSNIDEHFQKAGFPEDKIYECHGSLGYVQCIEPCSSDSTEPKIWRLTQDMYPVVDPDTLAVKIPEDIDLTVENKKKYFPVCDDCGNVARPNVSMAGDYSDTWVGKRSLEQKHRLVEWLEDLMGKKVLNGEGSPGRKKMKKNDENDVNVVILEVGCGDSIHSIKFESELLLEQSPQVKLIRLNPMLDRSFVGGHVGIGLGAKDALERICGEVWKSEDREGDVVNVVDDVEDKVSMKRKMEEEDHTVNKKLKTEPNTL